MASKAYQSTPIKERLFMALKAYQVHFNTLKSATHPPKQNRVKYKILMMNSVISAIADRRLSDFLEGMEARGIDVQTALLLLPMIQSDLDFWEV